MAAACDFIIMPDGRLTGRGRVPGDKSISHRALLLGAMASGETRISNFLESADCLATAAALRALGVRLGHPAEEAVTVTGAGPEGLQPPAQELDCGNSGTSLRLLTGLLAGQAFESVLTGDASLRRRPMLRVIEPLSRMGAQVDSDQGHAPLKVHGRGPLKSMRYELPVASAQVKSALLLAGLQAEGETWLREPALTRDHTERMLAAFGCECRHKDGWLGVTGGMKLRATNIAVPGDLSSAAFFLVGAAMTHGAEITLENVGVNPTRGGIITLLRQMGADIRLQNEHLLGNEPAADIRVRGAGLHGIVIPPEMVPLAIDDLPALMIATACADGTTTLRGAGELRVKESDRLQAMTNGLRILGVDAELREDGIRVNGGSGFAGGAVDSCGDHRIAMAFAMAGLRARAPIRIHDCRNVDTSFPDFVPLARSLGLPIHVQNGAELP
ncbi:MAG: 3-phosphoshikimate 1-carboxyvinyltransferase [Gammaproteobacteria bacterium]